MHVLVDAKNQLKFFIITNIKKTIEERTISSINNLQLTLITFDAM